MFAEKPLQLLQGQVVCTRSDLIQTTPNESIYNYASTLCAKYTVYYFSHGLQKWRTEFLLSIKLNKHFYKFFTFIRRIFVKHIYYRACLVVCERKLQTSECLLRNRLGFQRETYPVFKQHSQHA